MEVKVHMAPPPPPPPDFSDSRWFSVIFGGFASDFGAGERTGGAARREGWAPGRAEPRSARATSERGRD